MTDRCKHVRGTQDKATRALARVRATIAFLWIMTAGPGTRVWYRNQTTGLRSGTSPVPKPNHGTPQRHLASTKTKPRDSAAAPRRPEDADSCERPKARGMAKSPAIARRFAVVRWKLGRLVSLLQLKEQTRNDLWPIAGPLPLGDRTVLKAENYPCLQTKVSSTAK